MVVRIAMQLLFVLANLTEFYMIVIVLALTIQRVKGLIPTPLDNVIIQGLRSVVVR